jgi:tetratricopeptide (TPR) repeat protein
MLALTLTTAWAQASFADGQKALERGDAGKALEIAKALNKSMPDELDPWGLIVDASRKLGKLDEAEKAAQWMINLRPEDPRGLWRVALLREDFGDLAGAEEVLAQCYQRVPRSDVKWRATLMRQMGRLYTKTGRSEKAKRLVEEAEKLEVGSR